MSTSRRNRWSRITPGVLLAGALSLPSLLTGTALAAPTSRGIEFDRTASGEWAVAGASRHDGYRGQAYVYRRAGSKWVLDVTLSPPERGSFARFGSAVAIEGNTLVVGAPWDDGWHGAAYLYERSGNAWKMVSRLAPGGAVGDRFGTQVSVAEGVVSLANPAEERDPDAGESAGSVAGRRVAFTP